MTPEQTLIEFMSTSASLHGVQRQTIRQLEWDILKVDVHVFRFYRVNLFL